MQVGLVSYLVTKQEMYYMSILIGARTIIGIDIAPIATQYKNEINWEDVALSLEAKGIVKRIDAETAVLDRDFAKLIDVCCNSKRLFITTSTVQEKRNIPNYYYVMDRLIVKITENLNMDDGLIITPYPATSEYQQALMDAYDFNMEEAFELKELDAQLTSEEFEVFFRQVKEKDVEALKTFLAEAFEDSLVTAIVDGIEQNVFPATFLGAFHGPKGVKVEQEYLLYPIKGGVIEIYRHGMIDDNQCGFKVLNHATLKRQLSDVLNDVWGHHKETGEMYLD